MIDPQLHEENLAVSTKTLRQFAALSLVIFGALGYWHGVVRHHVVLGEVLGAVALILGVIGIPRPEAIRPVYTVIVAATFPIGKVVSLVMIAVLFYGIFTPLGIIFRLVHRDVLDRKRPSGGSYWTVKPAVTDVRSYLRQS